MDKITLLQRRHVEKPWGRDDLPEFFGAASGPRIGEIWFEDDAGSDLPLLAKYLFTSEQLSVQVHPNDVEAREAGDVRGKTECWYIIDAKPGARVGLGFSQLLTPERARSAALDGSIERMLSWRDVRAGDFIMVPAGTVHAIGAGLTILEIQQNSDVTYRLFDYGRPRPLHVDEGLAVARLTPADPVNFIEANGAGGQILVSAPQFTVARVSDMDGAGWMSDRQRWILPIEGSVAAGGTRAGTGECLIAAAGEPFSVEDGAVAIVAAEGAL